MCLCWLIEQINSHTQTHIHTHIFSTNSLTKYETTEATATTTRRNYFLSLSLSLCFYLQK